MPYKPNVIDYLSVHLLFIKNREMLSLVIEFPLLPDRGEKVVSCHPLKNDKIYFPLIAIPGFCSTMSLFWSTTIFPFTIT